MLAITMKHEWIEIIWSTISPEKGSFSWLNFYCDIELCQSCLIFLTSKWWLLLALSPLSSYVLFVYIITLFFYNSFSWDRKEASDPHSSPPERERLYSLSSSLENPKEDPVMAWPLTRPGRGPIYWDSNEERFIFNCTINVAGVFYAENNNSLVKGSLINI